jgi:hypothetical protein
VHFAATAGSLFCKFSLTIDAHTCATAMQTRELMTGQTLYFYAGAGSGVILLDGDARVTVGNMQMDGYGWLEEVRLSGSSAWLVPGSGWLRIYARKRTLFYVAEPRPAFLRCWEGLLKAVSVLGRQSPG